MNSTFDAHLKRGHLLYDQGRYADAEQFLRQALNENPHCAEALILLSWCQLHQEDRTGDALDTVGIAVELDPGSAHVHGLRALILSKLRRHKEAHGAADHAIALDPDDPFSHSVKAQAFAGQQQWALMEQAARKALALDGDHEFAQNLLTQALLLQGKTEENASNVERQLSRAPDDPMPHFNAGYAALRRGDHRKAEEHFRESLRLDPGFDAAREGMLESFRARSIVYRSYLKWSFWLARFSSTYRLGIIIGLFILYRVVVEALQQVSPLLAYLVIAVYLLFALWTHVARGTGNLIVLLDGNARLALRRHDALEGILVGGGVCCGLLMLITGAVVGTPLLLLGGAALGTAAVPAAAAFNNDDRFGVKLYAGLASAILLFGLAAAVTMAAGRDAASLVSLWMFAFIAAIWMAAFGVRRD